MTGRRLYEIVTDEMRTERAFNTRWEDTSANDAGVLGGNFWHAPVAWAYLPVNEKDAWNKAAKRVSGRK